MCMTAITISHLLEEQYYNNYTAILYYNNALGEQAYTKVLAPTMPKKNVKEIQTGGRDYEDQQSLIWAVDKKDIWEMNM